MVNYHSHTYRCRHAKGTDEEYVLKAIEGGFTTIGFSDHLIYKNYKPVDYKAKYEEKQNYYDSIKSLKEKYKDKIHILLGFECEYNDSFKDYLFEVSKEVDYLIFGNHELYTRYLDDGTFEFYIPDGVDYLEDYYIRTKQALETGLFKIMVHPDLFMMNYPWNDKTEKITRKICKVAKENNVYLEINGGHVLGHGLRNYFGENRYAYPYDKFWKIAKQVGCKMIIGYDIHDPNNYLKKKEMDELNEFVKKLDLKVDSCVEELERKYHL